MCVKSGRTELQSSACRLAEQKQVVHWSYGPCHRTNEDNAFGEALGQIHAVATSAAIGTGALGGVGYAQVKPIASTAE